jgi:hypothetical protein
VQPSSARQTIHTRSTEASQAKSQIPTVRLHFCFLKKKIVDMSNSCNITKQKVTLRYDDMRAVLRLAAMATSPTNPNQITSHRLANLAQQLRLYKPPPSAFDALASDEDSTVVDARGKVFSPMAVAESTAPATLTSPDRFRHKTAAVLICLFEDSRGDLRVILTKRSSNLSSHSGSFL